MEELKESNPELTPNSQFELENLNLKKSYMTARNQNPERIDIINSKRKKAKDTIGSKLQKTFGLKKNSIQSEATSLQKSFKSPKKQKGRTKINQSLIDYSEGKSVKKTSNYNSQSFIARPQSTLK